MFDLTAVIVTILSQWFYEQCHNIGRYSRKSLTSLCQPKATLKFLWSACRKRSAIGSQQFDSHKWPTVFNSRRGIKGKPRNFGAHLCRSLYSSFTTSFYPTYAFYNKRLQTLFKDQLDQLQGNVFLQQPVNYLQYLLLKHRIRNASGRQEVSVV